MQLPQQAPLLDMPARNLIAKGAMQRISQTSAPIAVRARAYALHMSFKLKLRYVTAAALRAEATTWQGGSTEGGFSYGACADLIRLPRPGPAALTDGEMSLLTQRSYHQNDPPMLLAMGTKKQRAAMGQVLYVPNRKNQLKIPGDWACQSP